MLQNNNNNPQDATIRSGTIIYDGSQIGQNLVTGHNAIIRENNNIGNNVVVGTNSYLGPDNNIGNNVRIHTGCFIESTTLGDNVIVAPHVVFTNDPYPPCKICVETVGGAIVGKNTVIGASATILPGIKIGENCVIGAGSVVTDDIPDGMVAVGNPAKVIKKKSELKHDHNS
jgi:acetyltransferase-like isoleucine patch superfamily enzyme